MQIAAMFHLRCLALMPLAFGCQASPPQSTAPASPPISLESWQSERIQLPPEFAPSLPPGEELLLFAPGMFDAEAEDYWSYVFLARVEATGLGETEIAEFIDTYYDGLISAVASRRGGDVGEDPATVDLTQVGPNEYAARVALVDAFVTMEALDVQLKIRTSSGGAGHTQIGVLASPQAPDHPVWDSLRVAIGSLAE